ncbi:hypothetical protein QE152_g38765 [Popillia japonica]|uniref:Gag-like protein n=1 Tax=Popillia japonica TaxID=7064 RepID=A0AAW1HWJ0_POPJA
MPLILVKLSKDQKGIYNLKELVALDVSVEPLKANPTIGQCHRGQRYGHAQSRCTAPRRCVSCGGEHQSGECPRPKTEPPTCANCEETHPANYRGCIRCPKPKTAPSRPATTPKPSAPPTTSMVKPGISFSQVAAAPTCTAAQRQMNKPQTPKPAKAIPTTPGKKAALKSVKASDASHSANIASMLAALQKLSEQMSQVVLTCQALVQSELLKT